MTFDDFEKNPQGLIGKLVLYTNGSLHGTQQRSIHKIIHVTKTGFKINAYPDLAFKLHNGRQKGMSSDRSNWSSISECELITEEQAKELREEWKRKKEMRFLRGELVQKIDSLTHEQLVKIYEIIK